VAVQLKDLDQLVLGSGGLGEHPACFGPAAFGGVDQDGLADAGELAGVAGWASGGLLFGLAAEAAQVEFDPVTVDDHDDAGALGASGHQVVVQGG
jgi:hypothetical protein